MEKLLHFPAEIQLFIKKSSIHVKCSFDNCVNNLAIKCKNFILRPRKWWKKLKFDQKRSINIVLWRRNPVLSGVQEKKSSTVKLDSSLSPQKIWKALSLQSFDSSSKCSSVHVDCSFSNHTENFALEVQTMLAQILKMIKEQKLFEKTSICCSRKIERSFDNCAAFMLSKIRTISALKLENFEKRCFLQKLHFYAEWSSVHVHCTFDKFAGNFQKHPKSWQSKSKEEMENLCFTW